MSLKYAMEHLPLEMLVGEQDVQSTITPPSTFSESTDKDFVAQVGADISTDKIVYAYTESGLSKNKRDWTKDVMESIGQQVLEKLPVGYLGHIKPTDYGFEFPEPQVVWFGSTTEDLPAPNADQVRLWLKGYVLPTATNLKTWIKTKAVDSISVYGNIGFTEKDGVKSIQSVDLKSIDISRKHGEGLNSKIVSLGGEMDATYDDVRDQLREHVKSIVKSNMPIEYYNDGSVKSNYVYCYVSQMYISKNEAIVSVEEGSSNQYRYYKVAYSVDESQTPAKVNVTSMVEVFRKEEYVEVKDGKKYEGENLNSTEPTVYEANGENGFAIAKGEMGKNDGGGNVNLAELKAKDPEGYKALVAEVAAEMASDAEQKKQLAKVQKYDAITNVIGGEQEDVVQAITSVMTNHKTFVGEMAQIFSLSGEQEEVTAEAVTEKAKEIVTENTELKETVKAVEETVKPAEGQTVVEAVKSVIDINQVATAKTWIENVNSKFDELSETEIDGELVDDATLEFVRDDFQQMLDVKPENITETDWEATSIKYIEDNFEASVKKYRERLARVTKTSKAAGEMGILSQFSNLVANENRSVENSNEDPDIAAAKAFGFGVE